MNSSSSSTSPGVTVIMAFQGWNDVTGAALAAIDHLREVSRATLWQEVDPEEYYDFQVNQPRVEAVGGERRVVWRTTQFFRGELPGLGEVLLVRGIEPSFRWRTFTEEFLTVLDELTVQRYVYLGVVPADVPHTRPFPVTVTSPQEATRIALSAEPPTYEGPTGIGGVLIDVLGRRATPTMSLWGLVPQYALGGPAPKAGLALLTQLVDVLDVTIPLADLEDEARAWERGVAELLAADPEMRSYVESLEESADVAEHPEASGDAIARRFEQFLQRRDDGQL